MLHLTLGMPSDQFYNLARYLFATAGINWLTDVIRVALIDTTRYTFDPTHQYLSAVSPGAIIFTSTPLSSKTVSASGACSAANVVIDALTNANPVAAFLIYKDTGAAGTSPLIVFLQSYSNLPALPTGGSFTILWPTDGNGIFTL
jgi:hypothetical protein